MSGTKKITVVLADRDETSRLLIREYLSVFPEFTVAATCNNGLEAIKHINSLEPDLLIAEADLPGKDGFSVLQEAAHLPQAIFTAGTQHYAVQAFACNALDYLLKPFGKERFGQALEKYNRWQQAATQPPAAHTAGIALSYPKKILVESGRRLKSIPVADITHFKAERDYTWIHTVGRETYLSVYGISSIQKKLDPQLFLRVHRSYIINVDHINELYRDISKLFVSLRNNVEINVGRSYIPQVKQLMF